jgi:hypothetical protein
MGKRGSGAPRHPRSPVAKAIRTPTVKMRVVPDSEVVGGSAALRVRRAPGGGKPGSSTLKDAAQNVASDVKSKRHDHKSDPDKD